MGECEYVCLPLYGYIEVEPIKDKIFPKSMFCQFYLNCGS